MSIALLDVNMLIALAWPSHVHHHVAHTWFAKNHTDGWATCPLTQCAFVRVSSNPKIIPEAVQPNEALALLSKITALDYHVFWPDDVPFEHETVPTGLLVGHRQIIDAYLLGLCIQHRGKLITFDRGVTALLPTGSAHQGALQIVSSSL